MGRHTYPNYWDNQSVDIYPQHLESQKFYLHFLTHTKLNCFTDKPLCSHSGEVDVLMVCPSLSLLLLLLLAVHCCHLGSGCHWLTNGCPVDQILHKPPHHTIYRLQLHKSCLLTFKLRTRRCWVFSPRTKLIASIKLLLPVT